LETLQFAWFGGHVHKLTTRDWRSGALFTLLNRQSGSMTLVCGGWAFKSGRRETCFPLSPLILLYAALALGPGGSAPASTLLGPLGRDIPIGSGELRSPGGRNVSRTPTG